MALRALTLSTASIVSSPVLARPTTRAAQVSEESFLSPQLKTTKTWARTPSHQRRGTGTMRTLTSRIRHRRYDTGLQTLADVNVRLHETAERRVMETSVFFTRETWLDQNFHATKTDCDEVSVWEHTNATQFLFDLPSNLTLCGGSEIARMGNHAKRVQLRCAQWMMRIVFSAIRLGPKTSE